MENFQQLRGGHIVLLTTHNASGGGVVDRVINLASDTSGTGYFRIWVGSDSGRCIAQYPDVRIAPCNMLGRPSGSDQPGRATLLSGPEVAVARGVLVRSFPFVQRLFVPLRYRLLRRTSQFVRLEPAAEPTPWAA